jgi:cytoskeletal protein RodZ
MLSLGQELKKAREERGVTLHEIANTTHIGVRFLQAIENDSYDILPGGVFNRAFVRKFAKQVGFDEHQAIRLYEEQLEEMGGEPQRRYYTGIDDLDARPTSGNGLLFSLLALILLAAGAYLAYEYFKTPTPVPENNASQSIETSSPTPLSTVAPDPNASPAPGVSPATAAVSNLTGEAMRLQLIATDERCWVKVATDEAEPEEVTLQPGDVREFNASEKFVIDLGNLPALRITINGRQVNVTKLFPDQKSVVVKNAVITKDNYQQFVD